MNRTLLELLGWSKQMMDATERHGYTVDPAIEGRGFAPVV
jgi:hypothetical protein